MRTSHGRYGTACARMSLLVLILGLLIAAQAWGGEPGEDTPQGDGDARVEKHKIFVAPNVQIRGLNPNFNWVGKEGGYLGIGLTDLTPDLLRHFGVGSESGVMISEIEDGSPAAAAGLRVGDIITRAGDTEISGPGKLAGVVFQMEKGALLDIEYWRDGRLGQATATIEVRERSLAPMVRFGDLDLKQLEGLEGLENLGPEIMERVQQSLEQAFDGDWEARLEKQLEQIEKINVEKIEVRMEELRERMEELEERLEKKYGEGGGDSI